jgi:hypothetical protein
MKSTVYFTGYGSGQVPRQGATRQSGSGGGARIVERNAHKAEPRSHAMSPAGVSQLGGHMGDHATGSGKILPGGGRSLYAGPGYNNVGPTPCGEGPGAGRDVQRSGGQGQHGPVAGVPFEPSDRGWAPPPGGIHK